MNGENPNSRPPGLHPYWQDSIRRAAKERVSHVAGRLDRDPHYRCTYDTILSRCARMTRHKAIDTVLFKHCQRKVVPVTMLDEPELLGRVRADVDSWRKWMEWEFTRELMDAIVRWQAGRV